MCCVATSIGPLCVIKPCMNLVLINENDDDDDDGGDDGDDDEEEGRAMAVDNTCRIFREVRTFGF